MRIALARALFVRPALLLLDEPTNHLDLNACVWLERELCAYPRCLVVISHSQDFLNGVCTNVILMRKERLQYFSVSRRLVGWRLTETAPVYPFPLMLYLVIPLTWLLSQVPRSN